MREYERLSAAKAEISPIFLLSTIGEVTAANPNFALSLLRMARERDPSMEYDFSYHLDLGRAMASGLDRHALELPEGGETRPHSASAHLALGFQMYESGYRPEREWIDRLAMGLAEAHAMSMFNVDHGELRRATSIDR